MLCCVVFSCVVLCLNLVFKILNQIKVNANVCERYDDFGWYSDIMFLVSDDSEPMEVT